jgi:hypothetical protein
LKSKADTALCRAKAQAFPNIIYFEDNLLVWTFRKGKEKYFFEICNKMHGKLFSLRIHPAINTGEIYSRSRANGKEGENHTSGRNVLFTVQGILNFRKKRPEVCGSVHAA